MPRRAILVVLALLVWSKRDHLAATEEHWAFRELVKPELPEVRNRAWVRNPIDQFILARLEERGLKPSGPADRRTLIRRAYFDLIGLPPTPEMVQAFERNGDPGAYERLVDRLLDLPQYGEHWARHWLDVAHYADTHGNDHDYARFNAWPYRDYVIAALNQDKPYARFIQEQIAGDVLFPAEPMATVALGFLAAGPWDDTLMVTVREDTVDHQMSQVLDRDNMVTTVMSTFQSVTVHCARCHDHKFDPISQRDYYGLQAVFAGVDRADRPYDADPAVHARRRELLERKRAITMKDPAFIATLGDAREQIAALGAQAEGWKHAWEMLDVVSVTSARGNPINFARQTDGSWLASGVRPDNDTYIVTARSATKQIRALRLEVLPDESLPVRGPGRFDNGNFHLSEIRAAIQTATGTTPGAVPLQFARATVDHSGDGQGAAGLIDGKAETYWSVHPRYGEAHDAVLELKEAIGFDGGTTFIIRIEHEEMKGHQVGRFRLWVSTAQESSRPRPATPARIAAILNVAEPTPEQRQELVLYAAKAEVERELAKLPPPKMVYAATRDFAPSGSFKPSLKPRPVHLLKRGDIHRPGEVITPATLACIPGLTNTFCLSESDDEGIRRAELARWLSDNRNVLTWRSIVNRVWQYHFGRGLVDTPNDFGRMGSRPSNPELLDWLAVWFRDEAKGSLKALHKLILLSETWQQGSEGRHGESDDSENRLLWRQNRTRLTAEEVRDTTLFLSGRLDPKMGGPAAIQFVHRDKATFNTDGAPPFLDYEGFASDSPAAQKRAIYRFLFRTVPDPLMDTLDCPDGGAIVPVRAVSTTALQALATLNDHFLIAQCEHIADRIASEHAGQPVEALVRLMLQRAPRESELQQLNAFAEKHGLANTAHLLMNSNEFMFLD
jgi:hypothetical protein